MASTQAAFPGSILAGDPVSASDNNLIPGGCIGRDTATTNSGGTASTETILSCSPPVGTGRELRITACVTVRSDLPGGAQAAILEDSTQIQRKNVYVPLTATDISWMLTIHSTPSGGSHTYELVTGISGADGNTVTCIANGGSGSHGPTVLYVDDMGNALS